MSTIWTLDCFDQDDSLIWQIRLPALTRSEVQTAIEVNFDTYPGGAFELSQDQVDRLFAHVRGLGCELKPGITVQLEEQSIL